MNSKKVKNKLILTLTILISLLVIFSFSISAFAVETESIDEQIEELKNIIDSSSYSTFQRRMILSTAQELLESGIPFEDTKTILENSVEESLDAYNIKKVFDIILETQQEGLPTEPLINKINEGFAKNVEDTIIISVVSTRAEHLKKAVGILNEARQEGLQIDDGEEIIKILADSLENDVPSESLFWLVKRGTAEGKSIEEITEISEELSYLSLMASDSGLSPEKISLLFKKAMDDSSNINDICENIQKNLETEISTAKIESGGVKPSSTTLIDGTSPTSLPGESSETTIGETPAQEAGEAPTETGSSPEPSTSSGGSAPPPPEN
ncbi:MAG TPA: hypothetical protein DEG96_02610 [Candidatus Atribacteria bacterium]|nr:hypothetical protein [Candidatus Atribacteria bacterium]